MTRPQTPRQALAARRAALVTHLEAFAVVRVTATAYTRAADAIAVTLECDPDDLQTYKPGEIHLDDDSGGAPVTFDYLRAWGRALLHAADAAEADPLFMRALRSRDAKLRAAGRAGAAGTPPRAAVKRAPAKRQR